MFFDDYSHNVKKITVNVKNDKYDEYDKYDKVSTDDKSKIKIKIKIKR